MLCLFQRTDLCRITAELLAQSADLPTSNMFCKSILHRGSFSITKIVWDTICIGDTINPSWVHIMANGLSEINQCCCFAFKRHWKKQVQSRKQFSSIFRADAYCTFSSCPVTARLSITKQNIHADSVIVEVMFTGSTQHITGETKARHISLSVRNDIQQHFQMTHTAPSKEYHQRLIALSSEQYASGNRNGVGCSSSVIRKISSEARLAMQCDKDLIMSLLILQTEFLMESVSSNKSVKGFIQHINVAPFSVICYNEASVRLYHEIAKSSPLFCDATGTIVALPKKIGKQPTVYYYAIVLKHSVDGKAPIAVAELITEDHTVLSISFFLQSFRRAKSLLYGACNLINPGQVIIDRSQVLLISFLQVYCMESIGDYLHRAFRIVSGSGKPKDFLKILPHACTSHVMNSVKKDTKKWCVSLYYKYKYYWLFPIQVSK